MTTMFSKSEPVSIPWRQIYIDPTDNVRQGDLPEVQALAARIGDAGQLTPVLVTNGEENLPKGYKYRLRAGARRHKAFELLGWQSRQMLAVVRSYNGENVAAQAFRDTWSENHDRESVAAIDQADAIGRLSSGKYGLGGKDERPLDKGEIAKLLGVSEDIVRIGMRISTRILPLTKALVRAQTGTSRAPARKLAAWALMKTEEEQLEAVHAWIAERKEISDAGRKRAAKGKAAGARSSRDEGDDEGEKTRGAVKPGKKVGKKGIALSDHLQAALHAAGLEKDEAEKRYYEGLADGLRFVSGDFVGAGLLPKVKKTHYDAAMKKDDEE